jgi:hypothetical protein
MKLGRRALSPELREALGRVLLFLTRPPGSLGFYVAVLVKSVNVYEEYEVLA